MRFLIRTLFFALSLSFIGNSFAADLTGAWTGQLKQKPGGFVQEYFFEMEILQRGDVVSGQSKIYINEYYARMELKGKVSGDSLIWEETKILDYDFELGYEWCIKSGILVLTQDGDRFYLDGAWEGEISVGPCNPGEIHLVKENFDNEELAENAVKEEFGAEGLKRLQFREVKDGQIVEIHSREFSVSVYDHLKEDNDIVTLIYNGDKIVTEHRLEKEKKKVKLKYDFLAEVNYLCLHAENLGIYPPNTATLVVKDSKGSQTIKLESDLHHSDVIYLKYIP